MPTYNLHSFATQFEFITIDDYADIRTITKVDLTEMDVEGAELLTLQRTHKTIKRLRPRLAFCGYHLLNDIFEISKLIAATVVELNSAFKWVQLLNAWKAVLFAPAIEA